MIEHPTQCARGCYDSCLLLASLDAGGRLRALRDDPASPLALERSCPRALADPARLTRDRVARPTGLRAGEREEMGWEEALVVVDPVRTASARGADHWLRPRPGSDVALAYGVMERLWTRDLIDRTFLREWTRGGDLLAEEALAWTPERVEQFTGVPRAEVDALAAAYAARRPSATLPGIGLQKCDQGADQVRAVTLIPALLGQHRGFFYSNDAAHLVNEATINGRALAARPGPVVSQVALPAALRAGRFRFVWITGMNPALTLPDTRAVLDGLARDDVFVVVHDPTGPPPPGAPTSRCRRPPGWRRTTW